MSSWCASSLGARVEDSALIYMGSGALSALCKARKACNSRPFPPSWQPSWKLEQGRIPTVEFRYKITQLHGGLERNVSMEDWSATFRICGKARRSAAKVTD